MPKRKKTVKKTVKKKPSPSVSKKTSLSKKKVARPTKKQRVLPPSAAVFETSPTPPDLPSAHPVAGSAAASFVQLKGDIEKEVAGVLQMEATDWNKSVTEFQISEIKPVTSSGYDTRIYDAFGSALNVKIDNSCAPLQLGAVLGHTSANAVLFQKCQYARSPYFYGAPTCANTSGVVHVELLDNEAEVEAWKGRCKFYYQLSNIRPGYTLKIESAWTCDSSAVEFPGFANLRAASKGRQGKVGFVLAAVPSPERYVYWPLREYVLTSVPNIIASKKPASGKWWHFDWDKVETKYYNGSGIASVLLDLAFSLNLDPSALNPDLLGVLIDTKAPFSENPAAGVSLVISPLPKLMPPITVKPEAADEIKKTVIIIMEAIKAAIYGGIETQAGHRISPYQPNINKWRGIMRGLMGIGVTTWFIEYFWPAVFDVSRMSAAFGFSGLPQWLVGKVGGLLFVSLITLGRMAFMGEFIRVVTKGAMEQRVPGPRYLSRQS